MINLLGKGRAKKGMLEGDLESGELEVGQIVGQIKEVLTCAEIINALVLEYNDTKSSL